MKKILAVLIATIGLLLTSCNYQVADLHYNFKKVHVFNTQQCYEIESWRDYEDGDQIQVKIKGCGTCLFHSSSIILIESKCPVCDKSSFAGK